MTYPYLLKLRQAVRLVSDGDDLLLACTDGRALRSRQPGPGIRALLEGLGQGGQAAEQLVERAMAAEPLADVSRLYFLLASLENKGFLNYMLAVEGRPLATLEAISPNFRFSHKAYSGPLRLSRFACLRREAEKMLAESLLGHARVLLHDARLCALPALLAVPCGIDHLATLLPTFAPQLLEPMLTLLENAGVVFRCDTLAQGLIAEETDPALRHWEFHDLFFHTRSRAGRHEYRWAAPSVSKMNCRMRRR
jgi:hypothetical protein